MIGNSGTAPRSMRYLIIECGSTATTAVHIELYHDVIVVTSNADSNAPTSGYVHRSPSVPRYNYISPRPAPRRNYKGAYVEILPRAFFRPPELESSPHPAAPHVRQAGWRLATLTRHTSTSL